MRQFDFLPYFQVYHYGAFEDILGTNGVDLKEGLEVHLHINAQKRALNSRCDF